MSQRLAGFESSCVITITSIPERKATEYFSEPEGERSGRRAGGGAGAEAPAYIGGIWRKLARPPRLERGTPGLEGRCSIRLSYGRVTD